MAISYCHARISLVSEMFCGVMQAFHVRCGSLHHSAETGSFQSPIFPSSATTKWISVSFSIKSNCTPLISFYKNGLITSPARNHTTQSFSMDAFHALALFKSFIFPD